MVIDRRVFLKSAVSYLPGFGFGVSSVISAAAERYPNRSVKVIVPFPPGGGTDVVARPVSGFLSRAFGQQFYIENKSGAGGNIGIEAAARSEPDGLHSFNGPRSGSGPSAPLRPEGRPDQGSAPCHPIDTTATRDRRASVVWSSEID